MLKDKIALVTGGSRGIGRATVLALARQGANVAINFIRHESEANAVLKDVKSIGRSAMMFRADVANKSEVGQLVDNVLAHFGRIDILVNNAGEIVRPSGWQEITEDSWARTFDVNLRGAYHLITATSAFLQQSDYASIVNLTSTFGFMIGTPGVIAYGAAKSGIVALTRSFAKALAPRVRVNCVAPGIIRTDMTSGSSPEFIAKQLEQTPLQRIGSAEEVADAILYLASPWSRYVTGQVLVVDGGHSLR